MKIKLLVIMLLTIVIAGCDEFETELTISPDGTGKLVQSGELSPMAQLLMDRYTGSAMQGWRPILSEEEADAWRESNTEAGVKLLSYSSERRPDGSLRVHAEILFIDLESLARTTWGWPLRLSLRKNDKGQVLTVDDPARFVLSYCLAAEKGAAPGNDAGTAGLLARLGSETQSRLIVNLPGAALSAENAVLRDGNAVAAREQKLDSPAQVKRWLSEKETTVQFPADTLRVGSFDTPLSVRSTKIVMLNKPLTLTGQGPLKFSLSSMEYSWNRNMSINNDNQSTNSNRSLNIRMMLEGDSSMPLLNTGEWPESDRPAHMLAAFKDSDGNDLRTDQTSLNFNSHGSPYGMPGMGGLRRGVPGMGTFGGSGTRLGEFYIRTALKDAPAKAITEISGYMAGVIVARTDTVRVGPVGDLLNQEIELPGQTLIIKEMTNDRVNYTIRRDRRYGYQPLHQNRWLTAAGAELFRRNTDNRGSNNNEYQYSDYVSGVTAESYLEISCPAVLREVHIPFDFKDIEIP